MRPSKKQLAEFVSIGRVGRVGLGVSIVGMRADWGAPETWGVYPNGRAGYVYLRGAVEVFADDDVIVDIHLYFDRGVPLKFGVSGREISRSTTQVELVGIVQAFSRVTRVDDVGPSVWVDFSCGLRAVFEDELLYSLSRGQR